LIATNPCAFVRKDTRAAGRKAFLENPVSAFLGASLEILEHVSLAIGIIGVAVILWGVAVALIALVAVEARSLRGKDVLDDRETLRHRLGYYLLLGLEFLVAADIVHTILTPQLKELAILGAIVAIRTVISFSINLELRQAHHRPAK
jgi:uncharacterized membrane protein